MFEVQKGFLVRQSQYKSLSTSTSALNNLITNFKSTGNHTESLKK